MRVGLRELSSCQLLDTPDCKNGQDPSPILFASSRHALCVTTDNLGAHNCLTPPEYLPTAAERGRGLSRNEGSTIKRRAFLKFDDQCLRGLETNYLAAKTRYHLINLIM